MSVQKYRDYDSNVEAFANVKESAIAISKRQEGVITPNYAATNI